VIEPKLAFFQEQEKVFWNAVIFSKHKFSLVPKDVDAVDMAFLFNKCFRMIDPDVMTRRAAKQNSETFNTS